MRRMLLALVGTWIIAAVVGVIMVGVGVIMADTPRPTGGPIKIGMMPDEEVMAQTPLIQWGLTPSTAGTVTVLLPIHYADSNYVVFAVNKYNGSHSTVVPNIEISNNSQFKIRVSGGTDQWYWMSVGKRPVRRTR